MKTCRDCATPKPEDQFQRKKSSKDGLDSYCKECKATRQAKYIKTYMADPAKAEQYKASQARWGRDNPEKKKERAHQSWLKLRREMLDAYGRECTCCGETIEEFLTLEHVHRDGALHRQLVGGGANTYRDLRRKGWPQEGYTVLCMNCNWAARHSGVCPHQR